MKTLHIAAAVSAVLIGGMVNAQESPGLRCNEQPRFGAPPWMAARRGQQGDQMRRGPQGPQGGPMTGQAMRGNRGAPQGGPGQVMRGNRGAPQGPQAGRQTGPGGGFRQRGDQGRQGMKAGEHRFPDPQRLKEAGATDEQVKELAALHAEQQLRQVDLKAAAEKAEIVLKQLMNDPEADEKDVLKAVETLGKARTESAKQGVAARFKARDILGAEISKKLREMAPGGGRGPVGGRPKGPCVPGGAPDEEKDDA